MQCGLHGCLGLGPQDARKGVGELSAQHLSPRFMRVPQGEKPAFQASPGEFDSRRPLWRLGVEGSCGEAKATRYLTGNGGV